MRMETITIKTHPSVKKQLLRVLDSNGMTISEAVRLYLWQIVTQGGIPFKGFVSNKLPVKKAQASELDMRFDNGYQKLRLELLRARVEDKDYASEETPALESQVDAPIAAINNNS